jgi:hypothetical protein
MYVIVNVVIPDRLGAVIRINVDHEKIKETDYQWYSTLVHEMHHIKLSELEDMFYNVTNDKFQRNLHDHMIETKVCELTRIFVSLHPVTNYIKE